MSESSSDDVLRRKAKAGREGHEARVMSPARAMRQALSRAADALFELALTVSGVQCEQLVKDAMLRTVDDEMLFLVLDGPGGAIGAMAIDISVVAGIIERQTIGFVSDKTAPTRSPTATDAALVAPFIDMLLSEMTAGLGPKDGALTERFCFGARIESKRHLELIADADEFHLLRAQLELEGGAKRGELVLALPVAREMPAELPDRNGKAKDDLAPDTSLAKLADGAFMDAQAVLRSVIGRTKLSLSSFSNLKVGDVLPLDIRAVEHVELDAGARSERYGPCKLGQYNGMRAVQLRFGARENLAERFEAMRSSEDIWTPPLAEDDISALPDLSDLPGFEDFDIADEASALLGEEPEQTQDLPEAM